MSQFQYAPYDSSKYLGTIADLLQEPGRAQARAAEIGGVAKAQALQQTGQGIAGAAQYAFDPRRKLEATQLEMEQAQLAEMQRQARGRQVLAAALKQFSSIDPDSGSVKVDHKAIATALGQAGYPEQAESWLKTATGNEENLAKLDEMRRGYQQHVMATLGDLAYDSKTPQDFVSSVGLAAAHGLIDENTAHAIAGTAGSPQGDAVRQNYLQFSPKYQAFQAKMREPQKLGPNEKIVTLSGEPGGKPTVLAEGEPKLDEWQAWMQSYPKTLGKPSWNDLTPAQQTAAYGKFAESKADPAVRAAALAQKNLAAALVKLQEGQLPTAEDAKNFANDILNHRLAPDQLTTIRGRSGGGLGIMIEREMKKLDPAFNWEQAASEYQLAKSPQFQQTVRYMDYVGSSVQNVIDAAKQLDNGSVRSLNAAKNWTKSQLNNVDLAKFQTDRLEVADAIAKILQGGTAGSGTSDKKLEQAESLIRASDSPAAIAASLGEIKDLIGKRRSTLTKGTYLENTNTAPPDDVATTGFKEGDVRPIPGFPGMEQTLKHGKWIRSK